MLPLGEKQSIPLPGILFVEAGGKAVDLVWGQGGGVGRAQLAHR